MSKRTKYRFQNDRDGFGLHWLLILIGAGAIVWILVSSGKSGNGARSATAKPATNGISLQLVERPKKEVVPPRPAPLSTPVVAATNPAPVVVTAAPVDEPSSTSYPRPVQNIFEAQVALARNGFSAGSLDGKTGSQTRAAILAFQESRELRRTGEIDEPTRNALILTNAAMAIYAVTAEDLNRLQPVSASWLGKSQQTALDYETLLELLAEKSQANPKLIQYLNPSVNWFHVAEGTRVWLPDVSCQAPLAKAAFVRIQLASKTLQAFDAATNLLVHFPCSIAQKVEKRPVGELHVTISIRNPDYTFSPELFAEAAAAEGIDRKIILPPGANNPVGTTWIGLDKTGYGIHGTPIPEQVGRTESRGCFRLANWNAELLHSIVSVGTPIYVVQ